MLGYKYYQVGGTLETDNQSYQSYVTRNADEQLYQSLIKDQFCHLLNARQMGKSSLRVRITQRLNTADENIKCVSVDLTKLIGNDITESKFYKGFAFELISRLKLKKEVNLKNWDYLGENDKQRFSYFLETAILPKCEQQKIVIFVEEVDSIIKVPFKDNFFSLIRFFYNERADNSIFKNLTFCLIGVAKPTDLIEDKKNTPFNIGKDIKLTGFTFDECKDALIPGLAETVDNPELALKKVLQWTGGQPFLMQKLCRLIVDKSDNRQANVDEIVQKYFLNVQDHLVLANY